MISRDTVDGLRPSMRATSRIERSPIHTAICSRSSNVNRVYAPAVAVSIRGITPPAAASQRRPVQVPTPAAAAAASTESPARTRLQNTRRVFGGSDGRPRRAVIAPNPISDQGCCTNRVSPPCALLARVSFSGEESTCRVRSGTAAALVYRGCTRSARRAAERLEDAGGQRLPPGGHAALHGDDVSQCGHAERG